MYERECVAWMRSKDVSKDPEHIAVFDDTADFIIEYTKDLRSGDYCIFQAVKDYMGSVRPFTMIVAKYHDDFDVIYWCQDLIPTFTFEFWEGDPMLQALDRLSTRLLLSINTGEKLIWKLEDHADMQICPDWKYMSALSVLNKIACIKKKIVTHRGVPADYLREFLIKQLSNLYCYVPAERIPDFEGAVVLVERGGLCSPRLKLEGTVYTSYIQDVASIEQGQLYKIVFPYRNTLSPKEDSNEDHSE